MSQPDTLMPSLAAAQQPPPSYVDWKAWSDDEFSLCSKMDAAFFDAEVRSLLPAAAAHARVLELGFGNGPFLGWCRGKPIDYHGVEIDAAMRERARARGISVSDSLFAPRLDALAGCFDLIAAFDVIEHITQAELPSVFERIKRLLRANGYFVAKFPNGDSPFGRVNQHGDLTHVTTLGRGKISHLAALSGLEVVSIGDPKRPWRHLGLATAFRRLTGGAAKKVLEKSIRALYFGGEPVCFDRNTVAVLKRAA